MQSWYNASSWSFKKDSMHLSNSWFIGPQIKTGLWLFFYWQVYLVAGNRVLRVDTTNTRISKNATQVFLGPETGVEGMNEIIGLSISITSFCVLVTIKRTGLFAYSYDGKLRWSTGPVITQSKKYRQGCWKNFTDCFFDSAPVIDHCDANIYVCQVSNFSFFPFYLLNS